MAETIFVTGASGNVGKEVVKHLLLRGCKVIAAGSRNKPAEDQTNLNCCRFDFSEPSTWKDCLEGVSKVFLMRPPYISNISRDMLPFMKYMKKKGVRQVVFLSVQGAEKNRIVPHHKVEAHLKKLGLPFTFLRPSFFMQNMTTTHQSEIRDENMVFVPAGSGRTNFIDVRDIGEAAALMFFDAKHLNRAYTITGEKSYSYSEVAELLSKGLGKEIRYINPNPLRFISYHLKNGRKLAMSMVMLALYSVVKSGKGDVTTKTSGEILGRRPIGFEQFILDHEAMLSGSS